MNDSPSRLIISRAKVSEKIKSTKMHAHPRPSDSDSASLTKSGSRKRFVLELQDALPSFGEPTESKSRHSYVNSPYQILCQQVNAQLGTEELSAVEFGQSTSLPSTFSSLKCSTLTAPSELDERRDNN